MKYAILLVELDGSRGKPGGHVEYKQYGRPEITEYSNIWYSHPSGISMPLCNLLNQPYYSSDWYRPGSGYSEDGVGRVGGGGASMVGSRRLCNK